MAHPIFGVIYIQGDISRQRAPKGQLSTAQGTALGIRKLRTMRPVRAALTFHCFFYSCPYALVVYIRLPRAMPWAMENIGLSARTGYGRYWAFLLRQAAKPSTARQPHLCFHANLHMLFPPIGRVKSLFPAIQTLNFGIFQAVFSFYLEFFYQRPNIPKPLIFSHLEKERIVPVPIVPVVPITFSEVQTPIFLYITY